MTSATSPADPDVPTNLDAGKAEAIALARAIGARLLLLDEQRGRAAARRLGVPISGSLGVLVEAKTQGLISLVRPYLDQMIAQGRHISPRLQAHVLSLASE
jgi:predicted nucleic acid-binding protein